MSSLNPRPKPLPEDATDRQRCAYYLGMSVMWLRSAAGACLLDKFEGDESARTRQEAIEVVMVQAMTIRASCEQAKTPGDEMKP